MAVPPIIVLSERRAGLETLKDLLEGSDNFAGTVGLILGQKSNPDKPGKLIKMKDDEIEKSKKCNVILGTYSACGEGMDIPALNTLIFMSPLNKIKQAEGRIHRVTYTKGLRPLIIDIVDQFGNFPSGASKRKTFYRKSGYDIDTYKVDSGTILKKTRSEKSKDKSNVEDNIVIDSKNDSGRKKNLVKYTILDDSDDSDN